MIYLSGAVRPELAERSNTGYMLTPMMGNRPDLSETYWAADTGCFANPDGFDLLRYVSWLAGLSPYRATCLFVTAPDRFGMFRWDLAEPVLPIVRALGFPAALVAQPGILDAALDWGAFDVLFTGGPNGHRQSEPYLALIAEARQRGKWTHLGRVNSERALRAARRDGYDSADGTYAAFGPDINTPKMLRWIDAVNRQPALPLWDQRASDKGVADANV